MKFVETMQERVLIADGAMGTMLHANGVPLDRVLPELNLLLPEMVEDIHRQYVVAGADIILTNTFRASRPRLAASGLETKLDGINAAGVRIARQVAANAGRDVFVAGSIGPVHTGRQHLAESVGVRAAVLLEQAELLAEAGVDLLLFETFGDLTELLAGVQACNHLGLPIVAQLTFMEDDLTPAGQAPIDAAEQLDKCGAVAIGTNCTLGPQGILRILELFRQHSSVPLSAQPNAGVPRRLDGRRFEYSVDNDYISHHATLYADRGASIVGGCCGTSPQHIAAIARELAQRLPRRGHSRRKSEIGLSIRAQLAGRTDDLRGHIASGRVPIGVELHPPAGADASEAIRLADESIANGVDFVAVAPASTARAQMSSLSLATVLRLRSDADVAVTLTTWDRSLMSLQADLLGAQACGLRTIICRTGSPPLQGDYPNFGGVWDLDSVGLIELIRSLNNGSDCNGVPIQTPSNFRIGARVNPGATSLRHEIARAGSKIRAGADFLVTWPAYDAGRLRSLLTGLRSEDVPMLITLSPLRDRDEAEYLMHEVPDVVVPEADVVRLAARARPPGETGVDLALELLDEVSSLVDGVLLVRRNESSETWARFVEGVRAIAETRASAPRVAFRLIDSEAR